MNHQDELEQQGRQLNALGKEMDRLFTEQTERADRLDAATERLRMLSGQKLILTDLAEQVVAQMTEQARLTALLFWGHAIAIGVNAGRVILRGSTGGLFDAILNINLLQWQAFAIRMIHYIDARRRDTTLDQVLTNRRRLEENSNTLEQYHSAHLLYASAGESISERPIILNKKHQPET